MKTFIKTLIIILSLAVLPTINAQTLTQTVKGKIVDSQTGEPMIGASAVMIDSILFLGDITNSEGVFRIHNVPVGRASFLFSSLGYEEQVASEILIGSAKEVFLTINLVESLEQIDEVVIVAKKNDGKPNNEVAFVSARSFSVEEAKRFPASLSDPGRMALSYAGVSSSDDGTNEIVIRGNAPNQMLWRIEGMEVPDPNHFSEEGFSSGAISILNSNVLSKSDFFTGAFPAEYGNATSGVFDIKLRAGNSDNREYAFQFGVLGTDLTAEGPIKKDYSGSYLINYRYSTLGLLGKVIDLGDGTIPTFQDMAFKINLPVGSSSNFSLWGIGGVSEDNSEESVYESIYYDEIFESKTYMSGMAFLHFFKNNAKIESRISISGNGSDFIENQRDTLTNETTHDKDILRNQAIRFNTDYSKKFNAKNTLKIGGIYSFLSYNVKSLSVENDIEEVFFDEKGDGNMIQSFAQLKHRFNENITGVFGAHYTYFSINNKSVIEPRVGLEWKLNPKHTLTAGFGVHSRRLPLNQYFSKTLDDNNQIVTPNKGLDFMQATHYVLGYDWRVIKNGHLKMEIYYQDLNKIGITKDTLSTDATVNGEVLDEELLATGIGRNYGVELTFEKFFTNQYYFLATASLFDSKYQAANGEWYNSEFNYGYTFNFVGGKEFTKGKEDNNILGVNGKLVTSGGKRGTPVDLDYFEETGELGFKENERNTVVFKDYFRLDFSIYYRINKPKVAHIISLDIQNLTDQQNVVFQFYDPRDAEEKTYYGLGIIPVFNYKIEF